MTDQALRAAYALTALARMGVAFEDAMAIERVRRAVESAARVDVRKAA